MSVSTSEDMCQLVLLKIEDIPTVTEAITQKFSMYLMQMSNFFLKKYVFASLRNFNKWGQKSLFLSFQNSFSANYFPISQEPVDQTSSLISLWNNS